MTQNEAEAAALIRIAERYGLTLAEAAGMVDGHLRAKEPDLSLGSYCGDDCFRRAEVEDMTWRPLRPMVTRYTLTITVESNDRGDLADRVVDVLSRVDVRDWRDGRAVGPGFLLVMTYDPTAQPRPQRTKETP